MSNAQRSPGSDHDSQLVNLKDRAPIVPSISTQSMKVCKVLYYALCVWNFNNLFWCLFLFYSVARFYWQFVVVSRKFFFCFRCRTLLLILDTLWRKTFSWYKVVTRSFETLSSTVCSQLQQTIVNRNRTTKIFYFLAAQFFLLNMSLIVTNEFVNSAHSTHQRLLKIWYP